jgi:putative endonuclease
MNSYWSGIVSEYLAMGLLLLKGFQILKYRYKTNLGEIDIIAKRGATLVFVEVKSRKNMDEAAGAVSAKSWERISRAGRLFISTHPHYSNCNIRFDVILHSGFRLKHLDNVWAPPS